MLLNLHVKNLAIIDEIEVDFAEHFNVLTGETGAGKSIIIGSVNIALGGKVSKELIRTGAEFGLVELAFLVDENQKNKLVALGISFEDDTLMISRKITSARTINRINGETVTVSLIKQVADILIDIHGQNEQQSLLHKAKHLEILDRYGKQELAGREETLANLYREYRVIKEELENGEISEEERLREISFLQYEYDEIENARLLSGEEEELAIRYKKLSNAVQIAEGLSEIYQMTSGENASVSEKLGQGIRVLSGISQYDEAVDTFLEQLSEIDNLLTDFNRDISGYMDEFDVNEEETTEVERRLDLIRSIKAKYGATTKEVQAYQERVAEKLQSYQEYETHRAELEERYHSVEEQLRTISVEVSDIRKKLAKVLEKEIAQALRDLNFLQVEFSIRVEQKEEFSTKGIDDVEFLLSTNPGEPLKSLGNAASGGELSRIMLAIKAVLVEHDEISTMIFDEIDVGISGRTAQMVAEKMAYIGRTHQVICISHLAQIAAMADTQYLIEKESREEHTSSRISQLNEEESIDELARILGGAQITDAVYNSAKEMKELAKQKKKMW